MDSKSVWLKDATWKAIVAGLGAILAKIIPLIALYYGAEKAAVIQQMGDAISQVILALGGLVLAASGAIEAAHNFSLPPPKKPVD